MGAWEGGPTWPQRGGGDFSIKVYDSTYTSTTPPRTLASLCGHRGTVHALRPWSSDARHLLSASADGTVALWDMRAPSARPALQLCVRGGRGGGGMESVGVPLNSGSAASSSGGGYELHALAVRPTGALAGHGAGCGPREVVFGGSDGSLGVLDLSAGRIVAAARVHAGAVRGVDAYGPLLASVGDDGGLGISALTLAGVGESGGGAGIAVLAMRHDHTDKTLCARWHHSAPALISTSADKTALLYTW